MKLNKSRADHLIQWHKASAEPRGGGWCYWCHFASRTHTSNINKAKEGRFTHFIHLIEHKYDKCSAWTCFVVFKRLGMFFFVDLSSILAQRRRERKLTLKLTGEVQPLNYVYCQTEALSTCICAQFNIQYLKMVLAGFNWIVFICVGSEFTGGWRLWRADGCTDRVSVYYSVFMALLTQNN